MGFESRDDKIIVMMRNPESRSLQFRATGNPWVQFIITLIFLGCRAPDPFPQEKCYKEPGKQLKVHVSRYSNLSLKKEQKNISEMFVYKSVPQPENRIKENVARLLKAEECAPEIKFHYSENSYKIDGLEKCHSLWRKQEELGAWWLEVVNQISEEQWLAPRGLDQLIANPETAGIYFKQQLDGYEIKNNRAVVELKRSEGNIIITSIEFRGRKWERDFKTNIIGINAAQKRLEANQASFTLWPCDETGCAKSTTFTFDGAQLGYYECNGSAKQAKLLPLYLFLISNHEDYGYGLVSALPEDSQ
jgi:hypothetical protein